MVREETSNQKRQAESQSVVKDSKKVKLTEENTNEFPKGVAILKPEYIISNNNEIDSIIDDDAAEASTALEQEQENNNNNSNSKGNKNKKRGQNKSRKLIQIKEDLKVCPSIIDPESGKSCIKGSECNWCHDIQIYLDQKEPSLEGICPVWKELGYCPMGIKCRWLKSHFNFKSNKLKYKKGYIRDETKGEVNLISLADKRLLYGNKFEFSKSEVAIKLVDEDKISKMDSEKRKELENEFNDFKIKSSEKKKLNYKNKKILSPLTTVGNLPFRRLMKTLGADITFSEMAVSTPLINGQNSEWALLKAHKSEYPGFGIQIAASKTWQASKTAELISKFANNYTSEINLNCGCPIDLLFNKGEGSALMLNSNRMKNLLKVMNDCSGDIPITVKMRMGVSDKKPIAINIVEKLLNAGDIGAITIHGRSRQQRYTKEADWDYIEEVGKVVKNFNENYEELKDVSDKVNPVYLIGNGDCFTFEDWYNHTSREGIDSVMIARGALIKPWIFEEIEAQQYLDKSSTERLKIIEDYTKFALEHWGTDDFGINTSRRFLCEFLSFTYRYIPVGILDKLPPKLNQRPPKWRGRDEMETLLGSSDYKDWIKITELFLGKANENFSFIPKHKSNA
ncbi:tRNA-dihydrouridine synthase 3 [Pichia californica]|uniref:tRNA-dihydrouridine(47) synthase [NAD(P)(+)] n=1 Tax=Pichia californica TaxID=460514 RepID=A0A9P6WK43_9ASCO|nr:tRNA-dihydrouridine synthase 3 [[Candida] californica]KAG0688644.1 tRNA-dihydrouridine synthase 3 [[Candida] californica]